MSKKVVLCIFIIIIFFGSCATFDPSLFKKKPKAEIEKVDIESISFEDITLLFDVKISNPYPIGITLAKVSSIFTINNKQLFKTCTKNRLKVAANNSVINSFRVNLKYKDIIDIVKDYEKRENIDCGISGDIVLAIPKVGVPGVPDSYTFHYKLNKQIPTIKPVIRIKDFRIKKPSTKEIIKAVKNSNKNIDPLTAIKVINKLLSGKYEEAFKVIKPEDLDISFDVNFKIELKNKTKTKINFSYLNYDFFLNGDNLMKGMTKDIKTIGNKSVLEVRNKVNLIAFSKSITKALLHKRGDFYLKGETAIKLPDSIKKEPVKLLFDEKGRVKVAVK